MNRVKVDIDLIQKNPKVMEDFVEYYNSFDKFPVPDIDNFFNSDFAYQLAVWLDYFINHDINIIATDKSVGVFFKDDPSGLYANISKYQKIFRIDEEVDTIIDLYNYAVAELIVRIDLWM